MKQTTFKITFISAVFLAVLFAAGCEPDIYHLTMRVDGPVMHRSLRIWKDVSNSDDPPKTVPPASKTLSRIQAAYKTKPTEKDGRYTYRGKFTGKTPNDVGGIGRLAYFHSNLGDAWIYKEAFRGNDAPAQQIADLEKMTDKLLDIFRDWLKEELGQEKDFAKLDAFLAKEYRKDLKNILALYWRYANHDDRFDVKPLEVRDASTSQSTTQPTSRPAAQPASGPSEAVALPDPLDDSPGYLFNARAALFLIKRNYFTIQDIPKEPGQSFSLIFWFNTKPALLKKILARKVGLRETSPTRVKLGLLLDPGKDGEKAKMRFNQYIATTPDFKTFEKTWLVKRQAETEKIKQFKAQQAAKRNREKGEQATAATSRPAIPPQDVLGLAALPDDPKAVREEAVDAYISKLCQPIFGNGEMDDRIEIRLSLPVRPLSTNGLWEPKKKQIVWSGSLPGYGDPKPVLPKIAGATWVAPNVQIQKKYFGQVGIEGRELLEYVQWYNKLNAEQRKAWDAFLPTATAATLEKFKLPGEKEPLCAQTDVIGIIGSVLWVKGCEDEE